MYIFHMYSFNLLRNLSYNYDEANICFDSYYTVHVICYRINENLKHPFVEIFLQKNGDTFFTSEQDFISPRRLDAYKVSCESVISKTGLISRFQGYHTYNTNIYMLYRISHRDANHGPEAIICTLTDILSNQKYFNTYINNHLIQYFTKFKDEYTLYNIYNKTCVNILPSIVYNYIENNEHNNQYIKKYKTQFYMNHTVPLLKIINVESSNKIMVRNIIFDQDRVISYKQIITMFEK